MDHKRYAQAWKKKLADRREQKVLLIKDALRTATSTAWILAERYGVYRVYLFGSLAREYDFMGRSDIDLAVEGLGGIRYFEAVGYLCEGKRFAIDIVPIEDCSPDLKEKVIKEGRLLYGAAIRGRTKDIAAKSRS